MALGEGWVGHGTLARLLEPVIVAALTKSVNEGQMSQHQADAEWAHILEVGAERRAAQETSFRHFQQRGIAAVGLTAAGGYVAGARVATTANHPAAIAAEDDQFHRYFHKTRSYPMHIPPAFLRGQGSYAQRRSYGRSVIRGFRRKYITVI